jgi:hypothetical protein
MALQAGTLEVWVHGWTFAGLQADEAALQQSQGGQLCQCTGARTQVPAGNIGWGQGQGQGPAADAQLTLTAFPAAGTLTRAYRPLLRHAGEIEWQRYMQRSGVGWRLWCGLERLKSLPAVSDFSCRLRK